MTIKKSLAAAFTPALFAAVAAVAALSLTALAKVPSHARAFARSRSAGAPALAPDKGTFRILLNGDQVGKEQFEIASDGANWTARGNTEIHSGKAVTHIAGTLTLRQDGTPIRYQWSTAGSKKASATVDFSGATATIQLSVTPAGSDAAKSHPFIQQFTFSSPQIAVLDNNLYDQYVVLADLYDWTKKGAQTFSVLVPQEMTPGSATLESMGQQDFNGKRLEELRVTTQDNEVDLYLDHSRLVAISVPSAGAEIVRD